MFLNAVAIINTSVYIMVFILSPLTSLILLADVFFPVHSLRRIPGPLREEQIVETQRSAQSRSEVVSGNKELVYLELGFSFFLNQLLINTVSVTNRFSIREIQVHLTIS